MKILIVEDDADMRDLLRLILERSYYVPIVASHGKEGVEKAISEKPKLILMDIRMPIMDGWEAARAIRANPATKNIPILATTVLFRPHELKACLEAGCNAYMVRPFNVLDLQDKIRQLVTAPIAEVKDRVWEPEPLRLDRCIGWNSIDTSYSAFWTAP